MQSPAYLVCNFAMVYLVGLQLYYAFNRLHDVDLLLPIHCLKKIKKYTQGRRLTFRVRYSKIKQGPGVQKN